MRRLAPLVLLVLVAGCGGGDRITETREVEPFDRLEVSDDVDVRFVTGEAGVVRVTGGENVLDRVHTDASGGVLRVDVRDRGIVIGPDPLGDVVVEVSAATLSAVTVEGSGDVTLSGLDADSLELEVEGAADVDASGTVDRLVATIQGAGDADLDDLEVRTARVVVEGAADASLNVSDELDVTIEGAGDVTYRGDPDIRSDVHGAGDIRREEP
jgi:hypothetical protein